VILALLSPLHPKFMDLYYYVLLKGIHLFMWLSPLRYKLKEIETLTRSTQKRCVVVCNHRSLLDMYLFLSEVYKLRAVANASLLKLPLIGQVMWMSGHFAIKARDLLSYKKALTQMSDALKQEAKILVFPETHRCPPGMRGMNKFHLTAFQVARENQVDIIPVVVSGTDLVWPKGDLTMDFSHPVSIKALSPINPNLFKDTASLMTHVQELMEKELKEISI
jgi:1-acyl-sn-glycerol-3-phosphate acyltransferase